MHRHATWLTDELSLDRNMGFYFCSECTDWTPQITKEFKVVPVYFFSHPFQIVLLSCGLSICDLS